MALSLKANNMVSLKLKRVAMRYTDESRQFQLSNLTEQKEQLVWGFLFHWRPKKHNENNEDLPGGYIINFLVSSPYPGFKKCLNVLMRLTVNSQRWLSMLSPIPLATAVCVPAPAEQAKPPATKGALGTAHSLEHHWNKHTHKVEGQVRISNLSLV